ncbi:hypothetical protein SAMN04489764_0592 [Thermostaphylospora chromogena]|uniref:Uncharacterized protein n=1 Tax=Thermostaphylospora chromogena TaxID=35622 RepID=A0A1H1APX6_9ACTN|nr:hypothetical protein SAMN04489764_0592 [Thermostaphylospora chromogena]
MLKSMTTWFWAAAVLSAPVVSLATALLGGPPGISWT